MPDWQICLTLECIQVNRQGNRQILRLFLSLIAGQTSQGELGRIDIVPWASIYIVKSNGQNTPDLRQI